MDRRTLCALTGFASCAALAPAASAQYAYTRPIALMGRQANGVPEGLNYFLTFVPNRDLIINESDHVLTMVHTLDPSNTSRAELVLYSGSSAASLNPVARWGADITNMPGVSPGNLYGQLNINAQGMALFTADLKGAGVTPANDLGFFTGRSANGLLMLGRQGSPAADDLPPTITHLNFFQPVVNKTGRMAVGLLLGGATNSANNTGIYVRQLVSGPLQRLVYESAPAPGSPGQLFGQAVSARLNDDAVKFP
jgi:hypothetical protein